jgi:hypothetical protein
MFDVFKYLSDLEARAHMLEGSINPKTGKLYTKEQIARTLGIIDNGGNLATDFVLHDDLVLHESETISNSEPDSVAENYISNDNDDENKEDEQ